MSGYHTLNATIEQADQAFNTSLPLNGINIGCGSMYLRSVGMVDDLKLTESFYGPLYQCHIAQVVRVGMETSLHPSEPIARLTMSIYHFDSFDSTS